MRTRGGEALTDGSDDEDSESDQSRSWIKTLGQFDFPPRPRVALADVRVSSLRDIFYIPEWVSASEEAEIIRRADSAPDSAWVAETGRRFQPYNWRTKETLPQWIKQLSRGLAQSGVWDCEADEWGLLPDQVIINEYLPGQGISPHWDGAVFSPIIATLSLGGPSVMTFRRRTEEGGGPSDPVVASVILQARGLLVFRDEAYRMLHAIPQVERDVMCGSEANLEAAGLVPGAVQERGRRISMTFRRIAGPGQRWMLGVLDVMPY